MTPKNTAADRGEVRNLPIPNQMNFILYVDFMELPNVMASNSSSAAARKSQVAVAIALQSVNNKEASNANCE